MKSKRDGKPRPISGAIPPPAGAVDQCRQDALFLSDLRGVYKKVDAAVSGRDLACVACGLCCHFERVEHRLYLTTGELALLTLVPPADGPRTPSRCPYQVERRCNARAHRPLGCRLFFCPAAGEHRPEDLYEQYHDDIRGLHDRRAKTYAYVELTAGLAQVDFFR